MDFLGHDDLYKSIKLWEMRATLTRIASFPSYPEKCMINAEFAQRHCQMAVLKWTKLDTRSFFGKLGLRLRLRLELKNNKGTGQQLAGPFHCPVLLLFE